MKKSILFAAAVLCAGAAFAAEPVGDEIVFAPATTEVTATPGGTFEVAFDLANTVQCTTFQWWIKDNTFSDVAYDVEEDEYMVDFGSRLTANYSVTADYNVKNHNFLVLAFNATGKKLMPKSEGLFCTMTFKVRDDVEEGTYTLEMFDSNFNWSDGSDILTIRPAAANITVKVENSGIEGINADNAAGEKAYYDLTGRRVMNPTQGLYISNGEKVYIK